MGLDSINNNLKSSLLLKFNSLASLILLALTMEQISEIDFGSGRGSSGVDLRWHHPKEFKALSAENRDELVQWQKSNDGKKILAQSREIDDNKRKASGQPSGGGGGGNKGKPISNGA